MSDASAPAAEAISAPAPWLPERIERWPLDRLKPDPRNPRKHPPRQLAQLADSIRLRGLPKPIFAKPDGTIIAGEGRWHASKLAGLADVPVIVAPEAWSDQQCREYAIADNVLALKAGWDDELLGAELLELDALGTDLPGLGFSDKELSKYLPAATGPNTGPQLEGLSYSVVVRCRDETHQRELLAQLESQGLTCDALIS